MKDNRDLLRLVLLICSNTNLVELSELISFRIFSLNKDANRL